MVACLLAQLLIDFPPQEITSKNWQVYLLCILLWLWYLENTLASENAKIFT